MITGISIKNFKGISEQIDLEIGPITLLFGANSAGKSTILHALHYLTEVLLLKNYDADRTTKGGDFVDLGGFFNLVHDHKLDDEITIAVTMDLKKRGDAFLEVLGGLDAVSEFLQMTMWTTGPVDTFGWFDSAIIEITIRWDFERSCPFASKCLIIGDGIPFATFMAASARGQVYLTLNPVHPGLRPVRHWAETLEDDEGISYYPADEFFDDIDKSVLSYCLPQFLRLCEQTEKGDILLEEKGDALSATWKSLSPIRRDHDQFESVENALNGANASTFYYEVRKGIETLIQIPLQELTKGLAAFRYLGPIRKLPPRDYKVPKTPDEGRWSDGQAAWDLLMTGDDQHVSRINDWLASEEGLNIGYEVVRKRYKKLDVENSLILKLQTGQAFDDEDPSTRLELEKLPVETEIDLHTTDRGIPLKPHDVGIGVSQVIPVIAMALDGKDRLLAVEQPELHLHPRMQAAMGDLFVEAIASNNHRFIIETHSEHLILRLLRRIRETEIGKAPANRQLRTNDLAIYYLKQTEGVTRIQNIDVDVKGEFIQPWPDDFFEIDFYERFA